jgi:hypothetical protein
MDVEAADPRWPPSCLHVHLRAGPPLRTPVVPLPACLSALPAALYQQLAAKKLSRFREYAAIFPEACFVLIGDNGQVGGHPTAGGVDSM